MLNPSQYAWPDTETLGAHLESRGVSRRDFLKFCGEIAVILGIGSTAAPRVARALQSLKRPSVIWLQLQECTGCVESVLRTAEPTIGDLVLDVVSLDYQHTLMAAAGEAVEKALQAAMTTNKGQYLLVVTGSIPTNENGIYTTIGGRTAKDDPRGGGRRRRGDHRRRRVRALGQRPGRATEPDRRRGRSRHHQGQADREHRRLSAHRRRRHRDGGALPDVRPAAGGGRQRAGRCSRTASGSTTSARAARTSTPGSSSRRSTTRRRARAGASTGGVQGAGDVLALSDLPVEHAHELADRRRPSVHRLHRAELLGHDDAVLRPAARTWAASASSGTVDTIGAALAIGAAAGVAAHARGHAS